MEAMDLMDPRRRRDHQIKLMIGYVLVGVALVLLSYILLYVAYGFGIQDGKVIQNGLLSISSGPGSAHIYINGSQNRSDTDTKLVLAEGTYTVGLKRDGYRDWQRSITVTGGQVESYTYPLLFPLNLTTKTIQTYNSAPPLVTESSDQRWLIVERGSSLTAFDQFDLNNPSQGPTALDLPQNLLTAGTGKQTLQAVSWADDNDHVLLAHHYNGLKEYLLVDRSNPSQSLNLTKNLALPRTVADLRLFNERSDQYVELNNSNHTLYRISLDQPKAEVYLKDVLAFVTFGNATAYMTPDTADVHKADAMIFDGSRSYLIRRAAASHKYLLAAADYDGDTYLAMGSNSESTALLYRNPLSQLQDQQLGVALPVQVFTIDDPNYVAFSDAGRFVMFENGAHVVSYDAENDLGFSYKLDGVLDRPQTHVRWMDKARLVYVSRGQVTVVDFDNQNPESLSSADPRYPLVFDSSYKALYAFVPSADVPGRELFTATSLRTPADQ